jgi:hypothetical protein
MNIDLSNVDLKKIIENETKQKFDEKGLICCPFHEDSSPSLGVKFYDDEKKWRFKCFNPACNESGDAIDFIRSFRSVTMRQAIKLLGLEKERTGNDDYIYKVNLFTDWQKKNQRKDSTLERVHHFKDEHGNFIYSKAKWLDEKGKKFFNYYSMNTETEKIELGLNGKEEVPYNLDQVMKNKEYTIVIVEGEKDVDKGAFSLKGEEYIFTSVKNVKDDLIQSTFKGRKILILGDTGDAGTEYINSIKSILYDSAKTLGIVKLPSLEALGDNKDVSDWLENGKTADDLIEALDRTLDLKSKKELQQDKKGIFSWKQSKDEDGKITYYREYITNFSITKATKISFVDEDEEGIRIIMKPFNRRPIERIGYVAAFNSIKEFKEYLNSMDLTFTGKGDDLTDLKLWVNRYHALDEQEVYAGAKFTLKGENLSFITSSGTLNSSGFDPSTVSQEDINIDVVNIPEITKEELQKLNAYLYTFVDKKNSYCLLGSVFNAICSYQNESSNNKLHHTLIVGESGSGKSTILKNIVASILNYPDEHIKSIGLITHFAMIKTLSGGNYPVLFDEFKPSMMNINRKAQISDVLRNLYDRSTVERGNRSLESKKFRLTRPIFMAGEESYPNNETALYQRSCIIYLSKGEREDEHEESMYFMERNRELLNKLGRSLINIVLDLGVEEYQSMRDTVNSLYSDKIKDRVRETAVNIGVGLELYNKLQRKLGLPLVVGYADLVEQNLLAEVMEDGEDNLSAVEQMIKQYSLMIESHRIEEKHEYGKDIILIEGGELFIKTEELIARLKEYDKRVGAGITILDTKDFKKQAEKSGIITAKGIQKRIDRMNRRMDKYDIFKINALGAFDLTEVIKATKGKNAPLNQEMMTQIELEPDEIPF